MDALDHDLVGLGNDQYDLPNVKLQLDLDFNMDGTLT